MQEKHAEILISCVFVILGLIAFHPFSPAEFLEWDDQLHITRNPLFKGDITWDVLYKIWTHPYERLYIPVTYSFWAIIVYFCQLILGASWSSDSHAIVFTTINFTLHLFNSYLVYKILRKLSEKLNYPFKAFPHLIGTALFFIHPLQVETVVWISETRGLLAAMFSLLALLSYLKVNVINVGGFLIFAILAKPNAVFLIPLFFTLDQILENSRENKNLKSQKRGLVFLTLLTLPLVFLTKSLQPQTQMKYQSHFFEKFQIAFDAYGFYLKKVFFPIDLFPIYNKSTEVVLSKMPTNETYVFLIFSFFTVGLLVFYKQFHKHLLLILVLFLLPLLPTIGFLPFHYQNVSTVADRYAYVSLLGFSLLVMILSYANLKNRILLTLLIIPLTVMSSLQSKIWKNHVSFYIRQALIPENKVRSLINIGHYFGKRGNYQESERFLKSALELDESNPVAASNLGTVLMELSKYEEAEKHFLKTLLQQPKNSEAKIGYGILLSKLMRYQESSEILDQVNIESPRDAFGYYQNSIVKLKLGNIDESLSLLQQALALEPDNSDYKSQYDGIETLKKLKKKSP